jgi:hypothetical protein
MNSKRMFFVENIKEGPLYKAEAAHIYKVAITTNVLQQS